MVSSYRKKGPAPYEMAELIISGIVVIFLSVIEKIGERQHISIWYFCLVDTILLHQSNL
ncbi:unnamed protein product, partial [Rotaria magnacalcarata]